VVRTERRTQAGTQVQTVCFIYTIEDRRLLKVNLCTCKNGESVCL